MFYVVCPSHKQHAKRCLKALGIYDELVAEGLQEEHDTYQSSCEWQSDVSLGVYPLPKFWADKIAARMTAVFLTRTATEWEKVFGCGKFPGAPQRWLQEWIHDDHAEISGLMVEVNDPEYGLMIQPGPVVWLADSGQEMLHPRARCWVSIEEALKALSAIETKLPRVRAKNARDGWLQGVRVLDLCNVIAGPHSAAYLARFGAEVIKLDPAQPFYDCWNTVIFGLTHLRAKQSMLANIKTPAGREVLEKLIQSVDVVVWNATDKQVQDMGLDVKSLQALNPAVIFCQLDCFSGVNLGPRSNYLGYDDLVQATTGIMLRFGGGMDTPEEHAHVGTIDVMCGFGAALGVATALYQQLKKGVASRPRTSLSALSGLAQMPFCYDYEGRGLFDEPAGREANGFNELKRFYLTASQQFLMLSADENDVPRLAQVQGLEGFSSVSKEERVVFLATAFMHATAPAWVERLQQAGIAAAVCENMAHIRANNSRPADGSTGIAQGSYAFSVYADHPSGHTVTQIDPYAIRPTCSKIYPLASAEKYGNSTRRVLSSLGYDEAQIEQLLIDRVVSESWGKLYLPD